MSKKMLKITLFCVFVLFLFSSCSKNIKNCKILPKIELKTVEKDESDKKNNESLDKIKNLAENSETGAQISCNYQDKYRNERKK